MLRVVIFFASFAVVFSSGASASTPQFISGIPTSYIPGQGVQFDVSLPSISNLGSYNIDLVLESDSGVPGVDYFFDAAATTPAGIGYVFPSSANFFDAANIDLSLRSRITLSDFDVAGVNISPGVNDRVASVVFRTSASFQGDLTLGFEAGSLIFDTPDVIPTPVTGFDALKAGYLAAGPIQLGAVPEPATFACGLWGILVGFQVLLRSRARQSR